MIPIEKKTRQSFTDWVLEGQEDFENELLDKGFDEDDLNDSNDVDVIDRFTYRNVRDL